MSQTPFSLRGRNPDVLSCIANLSNDEVFTPPGFANRMLDTLALAWSQDHGAANLWANPRARFLDPCAKSGVFLREITRRLTEGLADQIPDLQARVDHILTRQVYGIGITELTAMLARRSVYCSKHANGAHSVTKGFNTTDGHIWFQRVEHTWDKGRCTYCKAGQEQLDRGDGRETHAYAIIHTDDIKARIAELFGDDMQFDVIIGNPPYQLDDGGYGQSAAPIYQLFVEKALQLDPHYAVFVTPSRWMAGGKGLDKYRETMLSDKRMRSIVDYPKLYEGFPGVKIRGGISYFLWDRAHDGPCALQTIWDGTPTGPTVVRHLDAFDVLVRRNEAVPILEKVMARKEATMERRISSRKPFGLATNFKFKATEKGMKAPLKLFANQRLGWTERSIITVNEHLVDRWKVLMTAVQGTSAAVETKFLSKPIIAPPGTACTETYLVAGHFDTEAEAKNFARYLSTRFVRFLVSLRKATQHATRDVYAFVPDLPLDTAWTDAKLYQRYKFSPEEIDFIEAQVAAHATDLFDEAPEGDDTDD